MTLVQIHGLVFCCVLLPINAVIADTEAQGADRDAETLKVVSFVAEVLVYNPAKKEIVILMEGQMLTLDVDKDTIFLIRSDSVPLISRKKIGCVPKSLDDQRWAWEYYSFKAAEIRGRWTALQDSPSTDAVLVR